MRRPETMRAGRSLVPAGPMTNGGAQYPSQRLSCRGAFSNFLDMATRKRAAKTTTGGLKRIGPIARKGVREAAALIPAAMPLRGRSKSPDSSGPVISAEPQGASGGDPRRPGQGGRDERAAHGMLIPEATERLLLAVLEVAKRRQEEGS